MNFYVAGKFEEKEYIRLLQDELRELGHTITIDWTWHKEEDSGFRSQYAIEDINGASWADAYVGRFISKHDYKGALVEMGAALAMRKSVYIIGHAVDSCLFMGHPLVKQFDNEDEFLDYIKQ